MGRWILILGGGVTLAVALALVAFSCSRGEVAPTEGYEPAAVYPSRTDPIVISLKDVPPPTGLHSPGQLPESIFQLAGRGNLVLPAKLAVTERNAIQAALQSIFGTPASPLVCVTNAEIHGLSPEKLAAGSRVYKLQCVQCHGMTGDGRGPTSLWVYPPARDLRQGKFKFVSTADGAGWPTRDDLHRILRRGIGGNSMPPFNLMSDVDIDSAAGYTLHLMFRGLVETDLIVACLGNDPPDDIADTAKRSLTKWFNAWNGSQSQALHPAVSADVEPQSGANSERIRRGHSLFQNEKSGCAACHVNLGRDSAWRYDAWGVAVKPPDLTEGRHRGGSEAADLFCRLRTGIVASDMPPASHLDDEQIWDLVAFLKALPDPRHLPDDVRRMVYPHVQP